MVIHGTPFQSVLVRPDRLLPGIHGLRGVAALAVILFHLVHLAGIAEPPVFGVIGRDFGKGVHLFFVLSAFSLMYSTTPTLQRPTWASEYFVKRFFRIAPLYYIVMAGMIVWPLITTNAWPFSWERIVLNVTFTFGFAPWNGIVWAGWTVGVEMIFYAVLPVLLLTVRSNRSAMILVLVAMLVTYVARLSLHAHYEHTVATYGYNWAYFSFAGNLGYFALGIYAYRLAQRNDQLSPIVVGTVAACTVVILIVLISGRLGQKQLLVDLFLWGGVFAALTWWQSIRPSRWAANRLFQYLGERSYSLYLLHPIVIVLLKGQLQALYTFLLPSTGAYAYFICAAALLVPLVVLAELTYRLVEVPAIRYGQQINRRLRDGSTRTASGPEVDGMATSKDEGI